MEIVRDAPAPVQAPSDRARWVPWLAAAATFVVLAAFGGRHGWHRDELYFIEAGHHPAWGYVDQPPLVPLLATAWYDLVGGNLWLFRLLPAAAAAAVAPVAAATSRRLGGTPGDAAVTAALCAGATVVVGSGHLLTTATLSLPLTALLVMLALTAAHRPTCRAWCTIGLVAGLTAQIQLVPGLVVACALVALVLTGPRQALAGPWPWLGGGVAVALAAPYLVWQHLHGWPQLAVAASVARGGTTTSMPRVLVVLLQPGMLGLFLAPVVVAGVVALVRDPRLRAHRWVPVAYAVLLTVVTVAGGKHYYAAGLMPVVAAAGVPAARHWVRTRARAVCAGVLVVLHVAFTAVVCLPVTRPGSTLFRWGMVFFADSAETVGWPSLVRTVVPVAHAAADVGPTAVLTDNYGQAGALDLARRAGVHSVPVHSGHNAYGTWGPPAPGTTQVVVVGRFAPADLTAWFTSCTVRAVVRTGAAGLEDGVPVRLCHGPRTTWRQLWPAVVHAD